MCGEGALRDEFLVWVESNATALHARRILIPERFRSSVSGLSSDGHWSMLSLQGMNAAVAARYPELASEIEAVGCPTCHTLPASDFVQTFFDRSFSRA